MTLGEESGSELTGLSPRPFGDVDGDGADEFAIGAPGAYNGDGAVYIYSYPSP
ncbi:MAG: FG-GAP repeat protein [Deltaproteobacteria bacterium]|nr:FG-GAP repeat protein [Deltaproteobacteria bacterium]